MEMLLPVQATVLKHRRSDAPVKFFPRPNGPSGAADFTTHLNAKMTINPLSNVARSAIPLTPETRGTIAMTHGKKRAMYVDEETPDSFQPRKRNRPLPVDSIEPLSIETIKVADDLEAADRNSTALQIELDIIPRRPPMNALPMPPPHVRPARRVFVFGNGDMGQLGLGVDMLSEIPRPRLHAWFDNAVRSGVLGGEGAGIEKIYAGGMHTLAIDESGKVWSWGINDGGSLGRITVGIPDAAKPGSAIDTEVLETEPMLVQTLVDESFRAVEIAAGDSVSVALSLQGQLRVWGSFRASDGLLGFDGDLGSPKTQHLPLSLPSLAKISFVQVACGSDHVLALTAQGKIYVWGNGQQAQLGRRIIERRKINGLAPERLSLRRITIIGTGHYHSFAVNAAGKVFAWGLNSMRQTGVSEEMGGEEDIIWQPTEVQALSPARLGGGRRVVQINGGEHHTLFLISDGSVYGCGRCDGCQLGLSEDHPSMKITVEMKQDFIPEPVLIPFPPPPTATDPNPALPPHAIAAVLPPLNPIARLSAGTRHNLAVSRAGHAYSWGFGNQCQLGLGAHVETQQVPTRVRSKALEGWVVDDVSAGGQHCLFAVVQASSC